jgi:hypothetical protein
MKYIIYSQSGTDLLYTPNIGDYVVFKVPDWVDEKAPEYDHLIASYFDSIAFDPQGINRFISQSTEWEILAVRDTRREVMTLLKEFYSFSYVVWHTYNPEWLRWTVSVSGQPKKKDMSSVDDILRNIYEDNLHRAEYSPCMYRFYADYEDSIVVVNVLGQYTIVGQ